MTPSQRIAFNTAATYSRLVVGAAVGLFSSRWVLNALGQTDFGLFSLVGSIIICITFLNTVLSNSVARHYAFSVGHGGSSEVTNWFNSALSIHLLLAAGLVIIGWPIGEYLIANVLTIPPVRISACQWVFRVSLVSAFASMVSIPFVAMFTAKQRMAELAVWNMLCSVITFTLAWSLSRTSGDRLVFYAIAMVGIIVITQLIQVFRAVSVFDECRIHYHQWFDRSKGKEIISFASWSLVGSLGAIFRNQGSAFLLNLRFGPNTNAAYGIANQVSDQVNRLAAAMISAFYPEIMTSEGRGERARMLSLAQHASKLGTILVLIPAIPLIVEMDYVIKVWLREPPMYTALFCQLIIITFIIDRLSAGDQFAIHATGRIATYEIVVGACLVLTLPVAWILFQFVATPPVVGIAFIVTTVLLTLWRALLTKRVFGAPIRLWIASVVVRCMIVALGGSAAALLPHLMLTESLVRLACVTSASITASLLITWFVAFGKQEREFVGANIRRLLHKISSASRQRATVQEAR